MLFIISSLQFHLADVFTLIVGIVASFFWPSTRPCCSRRRGDQRRAATVLSIVPQLLISSAPSSASSAPGAAQITFLIFTILNKVALSLIFGSFSASEAYISASDSALQLSPARSWAGCI